MRGLATSLAWIIVCSTSPAAAGGLELDGPTARAVARAGATTVSDDGGGALARNPAGLARRPTRRAQVGLALRDVDVEYDAGGDALEVADRAEPVSLPFAAFIQGWDRLVVGLAYLETGDHRVVTAEPAFNQPADEDLIRRFPHRYAATATRVERRTVVAGAAVRATPWLAVGASLSASRVDWSEAVHTWAGFSGINTDVGNPLRDLRLAVAGTDDLVLGGHAGVLVVPESLPLELALAASYSADANVSGSAALTPTRDVDYPAVVDGASDASATLPYPMVLRAGGRYVGRRFNVEVDADLYLFHTDDLDPQWHFDLSVRNSELLPPGDFTSAPSAVSLRQHFSARGAVDVELVRDFAWLIAGYAYTSRATPRSRLSSGFAELATHTIAVGAEAYWRDVTITAGYSRGLSRAWRIDSDRTLINPLDGGTRTVGSGTYDRTADAFGLSIEVAWDEQPAL